MVLKNPANHFVFYIESSEYMASTGPNITIFVAEFIPFNRGDLLSNIAKNLMMYAKDPKDPNDNNLCSTGDAICKANILSWFEKYLASNLEFLTVDTINVNLGVATLSLIPLGIGFSVELKSNYEVEEDGWRYVEQDLLVLLSWITSDSRTNSELDYVEGEFNCLEGDFDSYSRDIDNNVARYVKKHLPVISENDFYATYNKEKKKMRINLGRRSTVEIDANWHFRTTSNDVNTRSRLEDLAVNLGKVMKNYSQEPRAHDKDIILRFEGWALRQHSNMQKIIDKRWGDKGLEPMLKLEQLVSRQYRRVQKYAERNQGGQCAWLIYTQRRVTILFINQDPWYYNKERLLKGIFGDKDRYGKDKVILDSYVEGKEPRRSAFYLGREEYHKYGSTVRTVIISPWQIQGKPVRELVSNIEFEWFMYFIRMSHFLDFEHFYYRYLKIIDPEENHKHDFHSLRNMLAQLRYFREKVRIRNNVLAGKFASFVPSKDFVIRTDKDALFFLRNKVIPSQPSHADEPYQLMNDNFENLDPMIASVFERVNAIMATKREMRTDLFQRIMLGVQSTIIITVPSAILGLIYPSNYPPYAKIPTMIVLAIVVASLLIVYRGSIVKKYR